MTESTLRPIAIHYLWGRLGLVPPQGESGGTAPSGSTLYLDAVFTLLFLGRVAVGRWTATGEQGFDEPETHAG